MSRLGSLLDDASARKAINEILDDIRALQMTDGGWSWCPEMESSPWITRDVLRHFSMMVKAGADGCIDDSKQLISKGITYVDSETVKDYRKNHKKGESLSYLLDWLYVRSSFPAGYLPSGSSAREMSSLAEKARKDIEAEWKDMGIGQKAKAAVVLWRAGDHRTANAILESLRQFASESPEKGMWFDNLNSGFGGMSVLQTTTLVLEAFAEIQPANKIIDSLRQWLVLGRQYQDWGRSTYTVETVNAILTSGTDWTDASSSSDPEFTLKGKRIEVPAAAKLTGAFTLTLNPKDASGKTLSIKRSAASPAWGGVISQYEAPIMEVKPADVPDLSIRKSIVALVEGADGQLIPKEGIELKKGMKVRVTLFITAGRDMDYVAVTDERSACLEPIDQLSGYIHCFRTLFIRERTDLNFLRHHKCGIETETEVSDDAVGGIFIFLKKFFRPRECNLIDIFIDIRSIHSDAMIGDGKSAGFLIYGNLYIHLAESALEFAERGKGFQFLSCVDSVGNELTQEDFMVAV